MPQGLAQREENKADVWWPTVSKLQNIAGIFGSRFLLDTACISKKDFVSDVGMYFDDVVVAIDRVLRSLRWKIL